MAKIVKIQPQTLTDIAEAIREKTETTELIPTVEMAQRIRDIETLPTDATATEEDLLAGKVAYNNDGRFVGSIEEFTGEFEDDSAKSDIDIYKQLVEGSIKKFDMELEIDALGEYAFAGCMNLTTVVLCKNIKSIHHTSFDYCINLKHLYFKSDELVTINFFYAIAFANCSNVEIHVKTNLLNDYLNDEGWSYIVLNKNFTIVGDL